MLFLILFATQLDLMERARTAATSFAAKLPNYICQQTTTRYNSNATPLNWVRQDVVSAALVYENGKEDYRDIAIDGKVQAGMKMIDIRGNTSTGEFATVLLDVLHASTGAVFKLRSQSTIAGQLQAIYDFQVLQAHSHWSIMTSRGVITPGYRGTLWVNVENARVMRLSWEAVNLPADFMLASMESSVDYDYVDLGAERFLVAKHSEAVLCYRASTLCSRNVIDWKDYHLYQSESKVIFDKDPGYN
jgi:hypothetical protein